MIVSSKSEIDQKQLPRILGPDQGTQNSVHFLLKGQVRNIGCFSHLPKVKLLIFQEYFSGSTKFLLMKEAR